jgi:16S rRNA (cytidine1402-2'-O)-methyltransferase
LGAERGAAICRELTKKFEEITRGPLAELAEDFADKTPKGEIVVLVDRGRLPSVSETGLQEDLFAAMAEHSMRDAVDIVAAAHNVPRRQVYQQALTLSKG